MNLPSLIMATLVVSVLWTVLTGDLFHWVFIVGAIATVLYLRKLSKG
jgi:hypothetical protein